jgi:hypothetical protein
MATKAERFRSKTERSGAKRAKMPSRPRRDQPIDTSKPGVNATDRKAGAGQSTAARNLSRRAGRKASVALEGSLTDRPSRKSTRKSANRSKPDSNLQRRETRRTSSPKTRATRASAERA